MSTAVIDFGEVKKQFRSSIEAMSHLAYIRGMDPEDIQQELHITLWKCCEGFNPDRKVKFTTYFHNAAKNRIRDLIKNSNRSKRKVDSLVSLSIMEVAHHIDSIFQYPSAEKVALWTMEKG